MATRSQTQATEFAARRQPKGQSLEASYKRWGWLFVSPWIIGFVLFYLLPMAASFAFTFTDFNLTEPDEISYVGLDNYRNLADDPLVGKSLWTTLRYAIIALPISIAFPLLIAVLMNAKAIKGKRLLRTLFYLPYMIPIISITYIFNGFLNAESGWLNRFLESLGLSGPAWLYDATYIYPALLLIGLWGTGNAMLILLAGLQTVPTELYEAARVDGAGPVTVFRRVTLPMISPVIFYNIILALIGLFRYFEIPYILSRGTGGPDDLTLFYNVYFYRVAFRFADMGFGSTLAWLMFVVGLAVTGVVFLSSRYWVYYAGERD
jgi:ABC-type sugar transport system permease subunit